MKSNKNDSFDINDDAFLSSGNDDFSFDDLDNFNTDGPIKKAAKLVFGSAKATGVGALKGIKAQLDYSVDGFSDVYDAVTEVSSSVSEGVSEAFDEAKKGITTLKRIGLNLLPMTKKLAPKGVYEGIESVLKKDLPDAEDKRTDEEKAEEVLNSQITSTITDVFKASQKLESGRALAEANDRQIARMTDQYQHKQSMAVISSIDRRTHYIANFLGTTYTSFLKKDLELKYRNYFVGKETLKYVKGMSTVFEQKLEAIKINTALPEVVKINSDEKLSKSRIKTRNTTSDFQSKFMSKLTKNIKGSLTDGLKSMNQDILPMVSSMTEMFGDMGDMGMAPSKMDTVNLGLGLVGNLAGRVFMNKMDSSDHPKFKMFMDLLRGDTKSLKGFLKTGANKFKRFLGNSGWDVLADIIPGYEEDASQETRKDVTDPKGAAVFDNLTRASIVDVIPQHLERIGDILDAMTDTFGIKVTAANHKTFDARLGALDTVSNVMAREEIRKYGTEAERAKFNKQNDEIIERMYRSANGIDAKADLSKDDKWNAIKNESRNIGTFLSRSSANLQALDTRILSQFVEDPSELSYRDRDYIEKTFGDFSLESQATARQVLNLIKTKDGHLSVPNKRAMSDLMEIHNRREERTKRAEDDSETHNLTRFSKDTIIDPITGKRFLDVDRIHERNNREAVMGNIERRDERGNLTVETVQQQNKDIKFRGDIFQRDLDEQRDVIASGVFDKDNPNSWVSRYDADPKYKEKYGVDGETMAHLLIEKHHVPMAEFGLHVGVALTHLNIKTAGIDAKEKATSGKSIFSKAGEAFSNAKKSVTDAVKDTLGGTVFKTANVVVTYISQSMAYSQLEVYYQPKDEKDADVVEGGQEIIELDTTKNEVPKDNEGHLRGCTFDEALDFIKKTLSKEHPGWKFDYSQVSDLKKDWKPFKDETTSTLNTKKAKRRRNAKAFKERTSASYFANADVAPKSTSPMTGLFKNDSIISIDKNVQEIVKILGGTVYMPASDIKPAEPNEEQVAEDKQPTAESTATNDNIFEETGRVVFNLMSQALGTRKMLPPPKEEADNVAETAKNELALVPYTGTVEPTSTALVPTGPKSITSTALTKFDPKRYDDIIDAEIVDAEVVPNEEKLPWYKRLAAKFKSMFEGTKKTVSDAYTNAKDAYTDTTKSDTDVKGNRAGIDTIQFEGEPESRFHSDFRIFANRIIEAVMTSGGGGIHLGQGFKDFLHGTGNIIKGAGKGLWAGASTIGTGIGHALFGNPDTQSKGLLKGGAELLFGDEDHKGLIPGAFTLGKNVLFGNGNDKRGLVGGAKDLLFGNKEKDKKGIIPAVWGAGTSAVGKAANLGKNILFGKEIQDYTSNLPLPPGAVFKDGNWYDKDGKLIKGDSSHREGGLINKGKEFLFGNGTDKKGLVRSVTDRAKSAYTKTKGFLFGTDGTENMPEGSYQDKNGKWHDKNGKFIKGPVATTGVVGKAKEKLKEWKDKIHLPKNLKDWKAKIFGGTDSEGKEHQNIVRRATNAVKKFFGLGEGPKYVDVYRKDKLDLGAPVLKIAQQEAGVFFADGSGRVEKSADINKPVVDKDNNTLVSQEDVNAGLVDKDGASIYDPKKSLFQKIIGGAKKFLGKIATKVSGFFGKMFGGEDKTAEEEQRADKVTWLGRRIGFTPNGPYQEKVLSYLDAIAKKMGAKVKFDKSGESKKKSTKAKKGEETPEEPKKEEPKTIREKIKAKTDELLGKAKSKVKNVFTNRMSDEELFDLGYVQDNDGTWIDQSGNRLEEKDLRKDNKLTATAKSVKNRAAGIFGKATKKTVAAKDAAVKAVDKATNNAEDKLLDKANFVQADEDTYYDQDTGEAYTRAEAVKAATKKLGKEAVDSVKEKATEAKTAVKEKSSSIFSKAKEVKDRVVSAPGRAITAVKEKVAKAKADRAARKEAKRQAREKNDFHYDPTSDKSIYEQAKEWDAKQTHGIFAGPIKDLMHRQKDLEKMSFKDAVKFGAVAAGRDIKATAGRIGSIFRKKKKADAADKDQEFFDSTHIDNEDQFDPTIDYYDKRYAEEMNAGKAQMTPYEQQMYELAKAQYEALKATQAATEKTAEETTKANEEPDKNGTAAEEGSAADQKRDIEEANEKRRKKLEEREAKRQRDLEKKKDKEAKKKNREELMKQVEKDKDGMSIKDYLLLKLGITGKGGLLRKGKALGLKTMRKLGMKGAASAVAKGGLKGLAKFGIGKGIAGAKAGLGLAKLGIGKLGALAMSNPITAAIAAGVALTAAGSVGWNDDKSLKKSFGGANATDAQKGASAIGGIANMATFGLLNKLGGRKYVDRAIAATPIGDLVGGAGGLVAAGGGLLKAGGRMIMGEDSSMTDQEIREARAKLRANAKRGDKYAARKLGEFERYVKAKQWAKARAVSDVQVSTLKEVGSSLWRGVKGAANIATLGMAGWGSRMLFGDNDKPMDAKEIAAARKKIAAYAKKKHPGAKQLSINFEEAVEAEHWSTARKLVKMEEKGIVQKLFPKISIGGAVGGLILGGPLGALAGSILFGADENKPLSEKEIKDFQNKCNEAIKHGNKSAQTLLNKFNEAIEIEDWKRAREISHIKNESIAKILGKTLVMKPLGWLFSDQDTPMDEKEIENFRKKMEYLKSQGDSTASVKLEKFEMAVIKQEWALARKISQAEHKSVFTRVGNWLYDINVGDQDKPMSEGEITKFRESMQRKINMGDTASKRRLDEFDDAVGRQNWRKAREISDTHRDSIWDKAGSALKSGLNSAWHYTLGWLFTAKDGEDEPLTEEEIQKFKDRMQGLIDQGDPRAKAQLAKFEDAVLDKNWKKARTIAGLKQAGGFIKNAVRSISNLFNDKIKKVDDKETDESKYAQRYRMLLARVIESFHKPKLDNYSKHMLAMLRNEMQDTDLTDLTEDKLDGWSDRLKEIDKSVGDLSDSSVAEYEAERKKKAKVLNQQRLLLKEIIAAQERAGIFEFDKRFKLNELFKSVESIPMEELESDILDDYDEELRTIDKQAMSTKILDESARKQVASNLKRQTKLLGNINEIRRKSNFMNRDKIDALNKLQNQVEGSLIEELSDEDFDMWDDELRDIDKTAHDSKNRSDAELKKLKDLNKKKAKLKSMIEKSKADSKFMEISKRAALTHILTDMEGTHEEEITDEILKGWEDDYKEADSEAKTIDQVEAEEKEHKQLLRDKRKLRSTIRKTIRRHRKDDTGWFKRDIAKACQELINKLDSIDDEEFTTDHYDTIKSDFAELDKEAAETINRAKTMEEREKEAEEARKKAEEQKKQRYQQTKRPTSVTTNKPITIGGRSVVSSRAGKSMLSEKAKDGWFTVSSEQTAAQDAVEDAVKPIGRYARKPLHAGSTDDDIVERIKAADKKQAEAERKLYGYVIDNYANTFTGYDSAKRTIDTSNALMKSMDNIYTDPSGTSKAMIQNLRDMNGSGKDLYMAPKYAQRGMEAAGLAGEMALSDLKKGNIVDALSATGSGLRQATTGLAKSGYNYVKGGIGSAVDATSDLIDNAAAGVSSLFTPKKKPLNSAFGWIKSGIRAINEKLGPSQEELDKENEQLDRADMQRLSDAGGGDVEAIKRRRDQLISGDNTDMNLERDLHVLEGNALDPASTARLKKAEADGTLEEYLTKVAQIGYDFNLLPGIPKAKAVDYLLECYNKNVKANLHSSVFDRVAKSIATRNIETAVSFDKNGKLSDVSSGGTFDVDASMPYGGSVIHNHPDGSGTSPTDIQSAKEAGLSSITTVRPKFTTDVLDKVAKLKSSNIDIDHLVDYEGRSSDILQDVSMKKIDLGNAIAEQVHLNRVNPPQASDTSKELHSILGDMATGVKDLGSGVNSAASSGASQTEILQDILLRLTDVIGAIMQNNANVSQNIGNASRQTFDLMKKYAANTYQKEDKTPPKPAVKAPAITIAKV